MAFLSVSILFLFMPDLAMTFARLEVRLNLILGIRQTDLIRGYFEYSIPTVVLALFICAVLVAFCTHRAIHVFLRSIVPFILILAPLAFWVIYYDEVGWPFRWPYRWGPVELVAALCCLILYLRGNWLRPGWLGVLLLAFHFAFWYWMPSTNPSLANYRGPIAPALGFCSAVAWGLFVHSRTETLQPR